MISPNTQRLCRDYLTLWGELAAERELSDKLVKRVGKLEAHIDTLRQLREFER